MDLMKICRRWGRVLVRMVIGPSSRRMSGKRHWEWDWVPWNWAYICIYFIIYIHVYITCIYIYINWYDNCIWYISIPFFYVYIYICVCVHYIPSIQLKTYPVHQYSVVSWKTWAKARSIVFVLVDGQVKHKLQWGWLMPQGWVFKRTVPAVLRKKYCIYLSFDL